MSVGLTHLCDGVFNMTWTDQFAQSLVRVHKSGASVRQKTISAIIILIIKYIAGFCVFIDLYNLGRINYKLSFPYTTK